MAHNHSVYDTDTHFSINPVTRVLQNNGSAKTIVIQHDHNSERMTFQMPRYIEGHDMCSCNVVQIHYNNIDTQTRQQSRGVYDVTDMQVSPKDTNVVICSWLVSSNATKYAGNLNFLIRFSCVDSQGNIEYVWNTAIYSGISISNGINNGEAVVEEYADILEQWYKELVEASNSAGSGTGSTIGTIGEIEYVSTDGNVITYLMRLTTGEEYTFTVIHSSGSEDGDDGDDDGGGTGTGTGTNPNPDPDPDPDPEEPTYTPVSIANFSVKPTAIGYGEAVKGAEITWSVTGEASSIILTCPNGAKVDLTNEQSPYIDQNTHIVTSDITWTLKATGKDGKAKTKTAKLFWNHRVYCGLSTEANYTNDDFTNDLKKSILTKSRTSDFKFDLSDNQYLYFAAPKELYGANAPKFQIGKLGTIDFNDMGDIEVTKNGKTIVYSLYRSVFAYEYEWDFTLYVT